MVDVTSRTYATNGYSKQPIYGASVGGSREYWAEHTLEGMVYTLLGNAPGTGALSNRATAYPGVGSQSTVLHMLRREWLTLCRENALQMDARRDQATAYAKLKSVSTVHSML